jgi:hypothetical protein
MVVPDNYEKIDDSFETGYENISNKELVHRMGNIMSIKETDKIKVEMDRRLIEAIKRFNEKSSKQTKWIIRLTIVLGIIALVQLVAFFFK